MIDSVILARTGETPPGGWETRSVPELATTFMSRNALRSGGTHRLPSRYGTQVGGCLIVAFCYRTSPS